MPNEPRNAKLPPMSPFQDVGVRSLFRAWDIDVENFDDVSRSAQHFRWSEQQWESAAQRLERKRLNKGRVLVIGLPLLLTPLIGLAAQAFAKWMHWL